MMFLKHEQPELYNLLFSKSKELSIWNKDDINLSMISKEIQSINPLLMVGFGSSGKVYRIPSEWHSNNSPLVVKIVPNSRYSQQFFSTILNEIVVLFRASEYPELARWIPRLHGVIVWANFTAIIMDNMPGTELYSLVENDQLILSDYAVIMTQLVELGQTLIRYKMTNLDLKLENLMYDPNTQSLSMVDLGGVFFHDAPASLLLDYVGSYGYMSPERYQYNFRHLKDLTPVEISIKCMTWITGICIIVMMTKAPVFWDKSTKSYVIPELTDLQSFQILYKYIREAILVPACRRATLSDLAKEVEVFCQMLRSIEADDPISSDQLVT